MNKQTFWNTAKIPHVPRNIVEIFVRPLAVLTNLFALPTASSFCSGQFVFKVLFSCMMSVFLHSRITCTNRKVTRCNLFLVSERFYRCVFLRDMENYFRVSSLGKSLGTLL
jgi:hypothetical protein